jgi:hypothetical protein
MMNNLLEDLFSSEELVVYQQTQYPFNLSILHKALKAKTDVDPHYEVWVPIIYYRNSFLVKKEEHREVFEPYKVFISNKGNVCSMRDGTPKLLNYTDIGGYVGVSLPTGNKKNTSIVLHRILGCCFIPVKEELGPAHPKDLQINHIDGIKTNFGLGNLEWTTNTGNLEHAVETNLIRTGSDCRFTKPIKGTVLKGPHAGYSFILNGNRECVRYGFKQPNVNACVLGRRASHRACAWAFATEEEIKILPNQITQDVLDDILAQQTRGRNKKD